MFLSQRHSEALLDRIECGAMNGLRIARCIEQDAAHGLCLGNSQEPAAEPFMKGRIEALEPIGGIRSRGRSRQPDLDGQIEDHREIRSEGAEGETVQDGERIESQLPPVALIGERRIGEAVGHDPDPLRQRRLDQSGHMVAPGGDQQQGFTHSVPALAVAFEEQPSDCFGAR